MFVRAVYYREQKTVHYFDEDGNETLYIGGSFAWRTNNPGNMAKPSQRVITTSIGLAQRTSKPKSLFLIFPDKATGEVERIRLLKEVYGKDTIAEMMERYAPRSENDTDGYVAFISKDANLPSDSVVGKLSDSQFNAMASSMEKKEGYIPGKIVELGKPKQVELRDKLQQPMAAQNIHIKSGDKTVEVKTDKNGALPSMYSKLFGDNTDLYYKQSADELEKIGQFVATGTANAYTFVAPYFMLNSRPHVHETKEVSRPDVHIVKSGENLAGIAAKYGVSVEAFVSENNLQNENKIFARQHLRIPKAAKGPAANAKDTAAPPSRPSATPPAHVSGTPSNGGADASVAQKKSAPPANAHSSSVPTPASAPKSTPAPVPAKSGAVAVDHQRNDNKHPVTVLSSTVKDPSGATWCDQFKGSTSLSSLNKDFKPKATSFIDAMKAAGITVKISAALRPPERSYLMYHAFKICQGEKVENVPTYPGVNIDWTHRKANGDPDVAEAKKAAKAMCDAFGINPNSAKQKVGRPGASRHNFGGAVDMNLSGYVGKSMVDQTGATVKIESFESLVTVGKSYGVHYYPKENMHWSDTGH